MPFLFREGFFMRLFNEMISLIVLIKNNLQLESSKMKTNYLLSLLIAFSFIALTSFSISKKSISTSKKTESVIEKDTFNIMASHGIYLRDRANLTCNKLAKLPYATKLICLNQDTISDELTVQETKYFEIKGRMQKVKVISQIDSLNDLEGYVFDGYLTKFPVPVLDYKSPVTGEHIPADLNYLQTNFETHKRFETKKENSERKYDCAFKQKFGKSKDINYKYDACATCYVSWEVSIPNLSIIEAYFFAVVLYYDDYNEESNPIQHILRFDRDKQTINIYPSDQNMMGCSIEISQNEKNILMISASCG